MALPDTRLPPLKPIPIKDWLSVVFIERGEIDVLDGAFAVVEVTSIRTRIPLDRYRLRSRPPQR